MAIQPGMVLEGKYEILKQINKGGMSVIYLAMDKRLNKQWVVKEIPKRTLGKNNEVIENKAQDAEMMKKLDHPAIPTVVDIINYDEDDYIYVVMDYIEGVDLARVLNDHGAQPQEVVIEWAKQICDALGYLHRQNPKIIYRDLKPANIMLKPEGNIKIIDFGIAREYKEGNLADTMLLGTKGYASPEHYGIGTQTDERSDIYTVGMTMHHLLTGIDPRSDKYIYAPIRQWNPELSEGLERVIEKCVSPDPKDRYQNCNELLYALDHYTEDEQAYKRLQKRKVLSFAVLAALSIVFAIAGITSSGLKKSYNQKNFTSLIDSNTASSYEEYAQNIGDAMNINPKDKEAGLEACENFLYYIVYKNSDGNENFNITEDELKAFDNFYNDLIKKYEVADKDSSNYEEESGSKKKYYSFDSRFAKLSYDAGIFVLSYYELEDGKTTLKTNAQIAKKYFENSRGVNFSEQEMANNLYNVCGFYDTSGSSSLKGDAYVKKFEALKSVADGIEDYRSVTAKQQNEDDSADDSDFIKLSVYKALLTFVGDKDIYRNMINKGKISKSEIISYIKTVEAKVRGIDTDTDMAAVIKTYLEREYLGGNGNPLESVIENYEKSNTETETKTTEAQND